MVTAVDFFCGAGGSSTGMVKAGVDVRYAANHWALAIETHNTNHPATEHDIADLQQTHASRYPRTDIAWFSPSCTNHSLAKGRKRKGAHQLDLWGEEGIDPAEERSRATMREVVEFTEYHHYDVVIVENVVDIRYWQHYDAWLQSMFNLGYDYKALYLNAQFFGVPQSRDRFYGVFWRKGIKAPQIDFRPPSLCEMHGQVHAVQAWKKTDFHWGRYGKRRQYVYVCPTCGREAQPAFRPAADVIDWSIESQKIGDRKRPLKEKTMQRILAGLRKFGHQVVIADLGPTQTTRQNLSLVQPFIASQHGGRDAVREINRELPCITTMNNEHALVTPPGFIAELREGQSARAIDEPLFTLTTSGAHQALITPEEMLPESGFRMLEPEELKRGMSFPDEYIILGNKRDQVKQVGNAVACNVAQWIAERVMEALA